MSLGGEIKQAIIAHKVAIGAGQLSDDTTSNALNAFMDKVDSIQSENARLTAEVERLGRISKRLADWLCLTRAEEGYKEPVMMMQECDDDDLANFISQWRDARYAELKSREAREEREG